MEYDLASKLQPVQGLAPAAYNAATDGEIIDSQGFNSLTFAVNIGAVTANTTLLLEHGEESDLSDAETVSADDLIGTLDVIAVADADSANWLGYIGKKRYVRLSVASGDATIGIVAIKGHPLTAPTL